MLDLRLDLNFPTAPDVDLVVRDELHAAGSDAERDIERRWPVDTGRSRTGWTLQPTPDGFVLENPTSYTAFVKGGPAIVDDVLNRVTEATAERLAESLPHSILAEVK